MFLDQPSLRRYEHVVTHVQDALLSYLIPTLRGVLSYTLPMVSKDTHRSAVHPPSLLTAVYVKIITCIIHVW